MIKSPHRSKIIHVHEPQHRDSTKAKFSVFDFFKQATKAIKDKSDNAITKIHAKIIQDPTVFKLPLQNRRKMKSQDKFSTQENKSLSKQKLSEATRSKPKLSEEDNRRLGELLKKKHDLMDRLRKIDQQLHNPSMLPVTMEGGINSSFVNSQQDRIFSHKISESRINIQQQNAYNIAQHERTMQMLTRINNEKMRRQQKIVSDMKKKQSVEMKKLQEIQKNKSKMQLSRGRRNLQILRAINRKEAERLQDAETGTPNNQNYTTENRQKAEVNEFYDVGDIQIGSAKVETQWNKTDINN